MTTTKLKSRSLGLTLSVISLSAASFAATMTGVDKPTPEELFSAVRSGNVEKVRMLLARGADPNAKDAEGTPVLMAASLYGNAAMMNALLDEGADPNAKNADEATALVWSAGNAAKARALVGKGADVNAQSKQGRTPLHAAAAQDGAYESVKLLVEKGADVNAADRVPNFATGGAGATPLMLAARGRDSRAVKYLLEHGAKVNAADSAGATALLAAARQGSLENVKLLLAAGANPNVAVREMPFQGFTPLTFASALDRTEVALALIAAGANVNAKDSAGYTPITWAAMTERGDARVIDALLKAGAVMDDTAAGWAAKKHSSEGTVSAQAASLPQTTPAAIRAAVQKSVDLMLPSGPKFFKVSGCVSCHNNTLPMMAARMAADHGIPVDQANLQQQAKMVKAMIAPATEVLRQATDALPDTHVVAGYLLDGLAAVKYAPDAMTTALVHNVMTKQLADGSWPNFVSRAPLENGDIQATAYAIRTMLLYGTAGRADEMERRIARARKYLRRAEPKTTEEQVMQLLGLHWAGADRDEVQALGRAIVNRQRADGGWAQLDTLSSDAYATGKVMAALYETRVLRATDITYRRGVAYLMKTQQADGSWLVKSRVFPIQPFKESGFPGGRDQWISAAATAWASMALTYALDGTEVRVAGLR